MLVRLPLTTCALSATGGPPLRHTSLSSSDNSLFVIAIASQSPTTRFGARGTQVDMIPGGKELELPDSYAGLRFEQIRVSHVPESFKEVTAVVVLTLYRPKHHNAFTLVMMQELERAFELFDVDKRVRCVVVTGHGKMFCAGADLNDGFVGGREANRDHRDGGGRVALAIHRCSKPVIAAIQGSAVGVGITMTLPMNIRIAYDGAKCGFVFSRRGLVMEASSSYFLPKLIGMSRAMHLVTTGAVYPASHRLLNDLFSETLSTPDAVLPRALELAHDIAHNTSSVSTTLMKEMLYRNPGSAEATHILDSRILYELFSGKDNIEGVKAFMEKRQSNFRGSIQDDAPEAYPWWNAVETVGANKTKGKPYKRDSKL